MIKNPKHAKIGSDLREVSPLEALLLPPTITGTPQTPDPSDDTALTAFTSLARDYAVLSSHTERLDAMLLVQAEALTVAKNTIKDLLPLHRALTFKDKERYTVLKDEATEESYGRHINSYNSIKAKITLTSSVRNTVRDAYADSADGLRIFTHGEAPNYEQLQSMRDFVGSVPPFHHNRSNSLSTIFVTLPHHNGPSPLPCLLFTTLCIKPLVISIILSRKHKGQSWLFSGE